MRRLLLAYYERPIAKGLLGSLFTRKAVVGKGKKMGENESIDAVATN